MKALKILGALLFLVFTALLFQSADTASGDKYRYGFRESVTLTCADTVEIEPNNLTLTYATMAADTNVVFNANADNSIVGDRVVLQITADTVSTRQFTFNSNITALADSVESGKTKLFEFIYNGTAFYQVSELQVD